MLMPAGPGNASASMPPRAVDVSAKVDTSLSAGADSRPDGDGQTDEIDVRAFGQGHFIQRKSWRLACASPRSSKHMHLTGHPSAEY